MGVQHILFVCTGNTCRSPLAEGLFRKMVEKERHMWEIRSAGVAAFGGAPISSNSISILRSMGAAAKEQSHSLTEEEVEWADLILTMTSSHKQLVIHRFPASIDKVFTLKEYTENDPAVLQLQAARSVLESELQIKRALSQGITSEELQRLDGMERQLPNPDIADPYGGSLQEYKACALEIEQALERLLTKLKRQ